MVNPFLPSPELMAKARDHYAVECALCHGVDGSGDTEIGRGLYPLAPDLRDPAAPQLSDGELHSIIHTGIRFTGKPGWDVEGEPDEHWNLVPFIRHLPDLTAQERELIRRAMPDRRGGHAHD